MLKISIQPNKAWKEASQFLLELPKRYEWFQFEFGKRMALIFQELLTDEISIIRNAPVKYKKRIAIAEIKDTQSKYWFAVAVRAVPLTGTDRSVDNTVLNVVPRFPVEAGDPIHDILQAYGPWTVDMIPFIPSKRFAIVHAQPASLKKVEFVRQQNRNKQSAWMHEMHVHGIEPEIRQLIPQKLQIVEDLEKVVNEMEFGFGPRYHPHWSKALRQLKVAGIRRILNDGTLIKAMIDPKFKKYRVKHLPTRMGAKEIREFEKFQKRLLKMT